MCNFVKKQLVKLMIIKLISQNIIFKITKKNPYRLQQYIYLTKVRNQNKR